MILLPIRQHFFFYSYKNVMEESGSGRIRNLLTSRVRIRKSNYKSAHPDPKEIFTDNTEKQKSDHTFSTSAQVTYPETDLSQY